MSAFVPFYPPRNPEECPAWLYETLNRLNRHATNQAQATGALLRGEAPDGSGGPLVIPDLINYFYKPGLLGGQTAYGGTTPGNNLNLSSTAHATKGFINFGSALTFNEVNGLMGIKSVGLAGAYQVVNSTQTTTFPNANLHLINSTTTPVLTMEPGLAAEITKLCTGASGDTTLVANAGTPFITDSGPTITAGMRVTGPGIGINTFVRKVVSTTRLWLTAQLTQSISVSDTVTFSPVAKLQFFGVSAGDADTHGGDVTLRVNGAFRLDFGVQTTSSATLDIKRPIRFSYDRSPLSYALTAGAGAKTVANVSAAGTDRSLTTTASFASVSLGDIVSIPGAGVQDFIVVAISSTTLIFVDSIPAAFGPSTVTFRAGDGFNFIEIGTITAGLVTTGGNLQFGGPLHGALQRFNVFAARTWFSREADATGTIVSNAMVGVNVNPSDFTLSGVRPLLISTVTAGTTALMTLMPGVSVTPTYMMEILGGGPTGTTPNFQFGGRVWAIDVNGALVWITGSAGSEVEQFALDRAGGTVDLNGLRLVDRPANVTMMAFKRTASWATLDAGVSLTTRLIMGANGKGMIGGVEGIALTRFGITSAFTTISNGTYLTIPLGLGLLHVDLTATTATVGLLVNAPSASQSADLIQAVSAVTGAATFKIDNKALLLATIRSDSVFADVTTNSKQLQIVLSGAVGTSNFTIANTAARVYTFDDIPGLVGVVGNGADPPATGAMGKVNKTGQTADIGSTKLTDTTPAGLYQVDYVLADTAADVTAGTVTLTVSWTDVIGATSASSAAQVLTGTGRTSGSFVIQLASGNITYATTHTGLFGSATYAVYIRVRPLG